MMPRSRFHPISGYLVVMDCESVSAGVSGAVTF